MKTIKTIMPSLLALTGFVQINVQAQNTAQPQNPAKPCDTDERRTFDFWEVISREQPPVVLFDSLYQTAT